MQHTAIVMGRPAAECLRAIGVAAGSMPPVCRALLVLATGSVVGVMRRLSCHDGILFQQFFASVCYVLLISFFGANVSVNVMIL